MIDRILASSFRVHRPEGGDTAALKAWMKATSPKIDVKRTVASGELVFVHLLLETANGKQVVFDIFRFDDTGKVTDQWMVTQNVIPLAEAANAHPHF